MNLEERFARELEQPARLARQVAAKLQQRIASHGALAKVARMGWR